VRKFGGWANDANFRAEEKNLRMSLAKAVYSQSNPIVVSAGHFRTCIVRCLASLHKLSAWPDGISQNITTAAELPAMLTEYDSPWHLFGRHNEVQYTCAQAAYRR
jgi:hypothetical protein